MKNTENRKIVVERIRKEIIGPGSDIFRCNEDLKDEIIEGKPLQRYFSGILFPKLLISNSSDNGEDEMKDEELSSPDDFPPDINLEMDLEPDYEEKLVDDEINQADTIQKYTSNTFFPSNFGLTFSVDQTCKSFKTIIQFGNYKKAKPTDVKIYYNGEGISLLDEYGLRDYISYDEDNKSIFLTDKIQRSTKGQLTPEYLQVQDALRKMRKNTSNDFSLYKIISKLFYKDKYQRYDNKIELEVQLSDILSARGNHLEVDISNLSNCNTTNWNKNMIGKLILHLKLYENQTGKYYIKVVIENKATIEKSKFSLSKEKVNQLSCFQTEIIIESDKIIPFKDYKSLLYKTDEDRMLDYLYRDKLAFGIGHNTSCSWENNQSNVSPNRIKSTFFPEYDVKNQSSKTDKVSGKILNIKTLSVFNAEKKVIISNLEEMAKAYGSWIESEKKLANESDSGQINIEKCEQIYGRIQNGINLLISNPNAMRAFQLANTAIYLQMFQGQEHFNQKKEGFEIWERNCKLQYNFEDYANLPFPSGNNQDSKSPEWRPFQLAFILQSIASFVDESSNEKELVDLLYFPTGGGKTEAYLAVSAFLIFWRRIQYSSAYGGVNIIIRYTLRLLSAQQFERASKLILACEFIRSKFPDLGNEKITIGFWVGKNTIPNSLEDAKRKLEITQKRLNKGNKHVINPFQVSNCQWCNTKMISRIRETDTIHLIGHRLDKRLHSYCLNEDCHFSEKGGGLPVVLIDNDIYAEPPTILFATVDKFAALAWKGEATALFNRSTNRKPDLIIQDELHLLNGTLGSLVGLFENAMLEICNRPKVIASTATVKNVRKQILGIYGREARVFPQFATNSDDTFFSKIIEESKRKYIGILPTGKTTIVTNLQLLSALLFARLEIWRQDNNIENVDSFWTLLSYFKSLKEIGRFSNKINSELKPIVKQMQARYLLDNYITSNNYNKISYQNIELTSRIPNEKIKRNLDKLEIGYNGEIEKRKAYDLVLATNMISVGLDVGRLNIMLMNGMPPNTAEYIQASSRVARKDEGIVITLYDPINSRDLSYFEDFIQFHKTFYKQVEPLSVTPFAENALDKMLFTLILSYFRHTTQYTHNNTASALANEDVRNVLRDNLINIFKNHPFIQNSLPAIIAKIDAILRDWKYKIDSQKDLKYFWQNHPKESLIVPLQEKRNENENLSAMHSMRSVEPSAEILIRQY